MLRFIIWLWRYWPELRMLQAVSDFGAAKRGEFDYLDRDPCEPHEHALGHLNAKQPYEGVIHLQSFDDETGLPDTAHCAFRCIMELRIMRGKYNHMKGTKP